MQAFAYANPSTLAEAVQLLASEWGEAEILAGGTDLISLMKEYVAAPRRVVNLKGIAGLGGIRASAESVRIGALVTFEELLSHPLIREDYPSLAEAARGVTSPQIRNMGTVAGDLCQRPRCWYYRAGFGLLALDKDGRSLVANGDNRYHAIFNDGGPAYFVSPSSLAPALEVLGASLTLFGPSGRREVPVKDFFLIPKREGEREHALAPNEIIAEIILPPSSRGLRNATYEVRQKEALDWPLAAASAALRMDQGKISSASIVMGQVAPIPWRAEKAEEFLRGRALNDETAAKAGDAAVEGARPLSRNGYKVQLARVAVKRALLASAGLPRSAAAPGGA